MRKNGLIGLVLAAVLSTMATGQEAKPPAKAEPNWLEPMKKLHEGFKGEAGYVAQLGDSITYSMAFWSVMSWADPSTFLKDDGLPKKPGDKRWQDVIKGSRDKGGEAGNYSGWTVGNLLAVIDKVLEKEKPEVALIMIGTNDISGGKVPETYAANLEKLVQKCLDAKCVPILNTIPPRRGRVEACEAANKVIKEIAEKLKVPLVDYYAECLKLQPGNAWDGTLIDKDGVHPTGDKTNDYSEENLKKSGYALRNWLNFLAVREVYFKVLNPPKA